MRPQPQIRLTPTLIGCVLGDGGISKAGTFQYACVDKPTVRFLWQHIRDLNIPFSYGSRRMKSGYPNKKLAHWVCSGARFKEVRHEWYPDGTKRVPTSLKISPEVLRWWFIGDGSTCLTGPRKNRLCVRLHSEGFPLEDNLALIALLASVGLKASLCRNRHYYYISLSGRSSEHFFEYIGQCPPQLRSMNYKWRFFTGITKKICVVCGHEFEPRWSHAILCSANCRAIRWGRDWYRRNV